MKILDVINEIEGPVKLAVDPKVDAFFNQVNQKSLIKLCQCESIRNIAYQDLISLDTILGREIYFIFDHRIDFKFIRLVDCLFERLSSFGIWAVHNIDVDGIPQDQRLINAIAKYKAGETFPIVYYNGLSADISDHKFYLHYTICNDESNADLCEKLGHIIAQTAQKIGLDVYWFQTPEESVLITKKRSYWMALLDKILKNTLPGSCH